MSILKQWRLLFLIAGGQLLCLVLGVFWFSAWLQRSVIDAGRLQMLQANEAIASFLVQETLNALGPTIVSPDDWKKPAQVLDAITIPNEGFALIVDDATGRILCHGRNADHLDRLRWNVRGTTMWGSTGQQSLATWFDANSVHDSQQIPNGPPSLLSGCATIANESHLISGLQLRPHHATLLVHQRENRMQEGVRELLRPIKSIGVAVATLITLLVLVVNSVVLQRYEDRLASTNQRLEQLVNIRTRSLVKTRNAIIFGLAKLAESRDTDTGEHLERIRRYVTVLAEQLAKSDRQINRDFISNLALASSLHDIGKVGIPDAVLLKPGRLDQEEREIIEQHPIIGRQCLEAIQMQLGNDDFLEMARMIADSHHERWDGKGYPKGLAGEEIPLVARIVALADVYDALTTKRPYKDAMSHEDAKKIILDGDGTHFDPHVVDAFLQSHLEFQRIASEISNHPAGPLLAALMPDVHALLSQPNTSLTS